MAVNTPAPPERPHRLFLSYSHKNEAVKDRLKIHLAPLMRNGLAEIWDDRAICAGADWRKEIETAMAGADAAIFLLEEYFLASDFCMDVEITTFLQRHREAGVLIVFIVTDHCRWKDFDYISKHKVIPLDGRPITQYTPRSKAYTHITDEIKNALARHQPKPRTAQILQAQEPNTATIDIATLLAKLPGATTHLFGRDAELAQIDGWKDHKGVFLWVADGGTGKSALVRKWLEIQDWPAGTRFLGHSFYSQGSHNQATSARGFLLAALKQLAIPHANNAADDKLGRLLAEEAAKASTVLVLDGIEPLQQFAKDDPRLHGMVKDRGLAALLEGLAKQPGQALCLASSRLPIPEASIADAPCFREKHLALLPPDGARELLRQRGVRGEDAELDAMAERCGHHPLTLVLAAEFCHTYLQDRAADFLSRPWQPKPGEQHAATVMAWFDSALADEHQTLDRELARILGLFDRPAPWGALLALKRAEPIPGLTATLHAADEPAILESLARLSQWGLLDADLSRREPDLDAHPLVREHFGELLERDEPDSWQAAHSVLFEWFCSLPDKEQPDTLEELEPLYRAVVHGCKAGRYRTALLEVYGLRTLRHSPQLGAYSANLAALAGFFPQGWNQPPVAENVGLPNETLCGAFRTILMDAAAKCLMSLGRLEEALEPLHMSRQEYLEVREFPSYCDSTNVLVALLTPVRLLDRGRSCESRD